MKKMRRELDFRKKSCIVVLGLIYLPQKAVLE